MKCPACASEMVVAKVQAVEIDRCPACGGIALDKGENEIVEALGLASVIEAGARPTQEPRSSVAHCHECARDMVALRGAGDIEYDWCDGCERLFFDRGELTSLDAFVDA